MHVPSSHTINTHPPVLLHVPLFALLCCLLVFLLFKMTPKGSPEGLSGVPKQKAATCLMGKMHASETLCSCLSSMLPTRGSQHQPHRLNLVS